MQTVNHNRYWTDVLADLQDISWTQIISILMNTNHGFSNYEKCRKRNHTQVRQDTFLDEKVKDFAEKCTENAKKAEIVLDEMCHLLAIQTTPTRKLKWAGAFFMKCITRIYSSIYVNTHLLPVAQDSTGTGLELFKTQFLKLSNKMPVVILPTHRSYMDFLFITYVMFINELPLPIVAAGDNFKALGVTLTNYLKATGAFLVRRNANNKRDIDASDYYDILRAYVHSVVEGGENPIEFFMEGTRTRLGQVLRPKTGLLSMVVDMYLEGMVDDICILPVAINYQRPIEEQLYIGEMTPQISKSKPKETAKNLISAFNKIMKRKYGKVYVRFLEPFKLSDYHRNWNQFRISSTEESGEKSATLHDLTNSLASKVCLAQANDNVLMPFNLMTYSMLHQSFLANQNTRDNYALKDTEPIIVGVSIADITRDFMIIEDLLKSTRLNFAPGWKGNLDILSEFKFDRDGIVRASDDRRTVEFDYDARTFHTFCYYGNQVMQIFLPIAISSLMNKEHLAEDKLRGLNQYKDMRRLLSREFLVDDISLEKEFVDSYECIEKGLVCKPAKDMILKHLRYFIDSYLIFLRYFKGVDVMVKSEFFQHITSQNKGHFISKDMLNNMMNLVKDFDICRSIPEDDPKSKPSTSKRREEQLEVQSIEKLIELIQKFQNVSQEICRAIIEE